MPPFFCNSFCLYKIRLRFFGKAHDCIFLKFQENFINFLMLTFVYFTISIVKSINSTDDSGITLFHAQ